MITFKTDVSIERPIEEVFAYVSDPLNFPRWNSAVQAVRAADAGKSGARSTYVLERQLPSGRAVNGLEIDTRERPREFSIRTTSGPTPFRYRYLFSEEDGETVVRLDAEVELQGAAAWLGQIARSAVKRGVDVNLTALKRILERR